MKINQKNRIQNSANLTMNSVQVHCKRTCALTALAEESLSMQPTKMPNSQAPVDIIFQKLNPTTAQPP